MKKEEEAEKEGGKRKKKRKRKEEKNPHPWRAIRRKIERVFNFTYHSLSIVTYLSSITGASNSSVKNIARSVHTYRFETLFRAIFSRFIHGITIIRRNFLPGRESRMGEWKGTREIWSGSMGKARELPSWPSRESRFAHARRIYASFETQWLVINERGRSRCEANSARSVVGEGVSPTRA